MTPRKDEIFLLTSQITVCSLLAAHTREAGPCSPPPAGYPPVSCFTSLSRTLWSRNDQPHRAYGVIHTEYKGLRPQNMFRIIPACFRTAKVAELVDALVLGASGETRESSNLSFRTTVFASSDISRARRRSFGIRQRNPANIRARIGLIGQQAEMKLLAGDGS